jgi:hypothetical protein
MKDYEEEEIQEYSLEEQGELQNDEDQFLWLLREGINEYAEMGFADEMML